MLTTSVGLGMQLCSAPSVPSVRCFKPSCSRHTHATGQCALAARLHLAVRPVPTRPVAHRAEPSRAVPRRRSPAAVRVRPPPGRCCCCASVPAGAVGRWRGRASGLGQTVGIGRRIGAPRADGITPGGEPRIPHGWDLGGESERGGQEGGRERRVLVDSHFRRYLSHRILGSLIRGLLECVHTGR